MATKRNALFSGHFNYNKDNELIVSQITNLLMDW